MGSVAQQLEPDPALARDPDAAMLEKRERDRAACRAYYAKNRERMKERSRNYHRENREACLEQMRAWKAKNKDKIRKAQNEWRAQHRDLYRAAASRTYQNNKEKRNEYTKRWFKEHRVRACVWTRRYRARKRQALGAHTIAQWLARVEFYGWRCRYCSKPLTKGSLSCDHRIPIFRGGTEWASNLVPCCRSCNSTKGDKTEREFLGRKGRL